MDRFTKYLLIGAMTLFLACSLISVPAVHGQQGVPGTLVQQSPTDLQACTTINATAAVNNTATVTITPTNGLSVYLCGWDITLSNDATGGVASSNLSFTSTNLGGWAWKFSNVGTASTNLVQSFYFNHPVKSTTPGTAVTLVSPAINLHAAYSISAYYYVAP